jgi:DNA (cytosine-5)-methyltransferase 1
MIDLFSGIGGFSLAAQWCWGDELEIVTFCEMDKFCQKVLKKHWPNVPIVEDVNEFHGTTFKAVDLITGGFPCQDLSCAGKGAGIEGARSGLWQQLCRIISEVRPRYAIVENVTALLQGKRGAWFGRVLGDLAEIGYDAEWHCIPASRVGAPHKRDRIWIIAYPKKAINSIMSANQADRDRARISFKLRRVPWWPSYARIRRANDGIPNWMDRVGALGNAIVPQVALQIMRAIKETDRKGELCRR